MPDIANSNDNKSGWLNYYLESLSHAELDELYVSKPLREELYGSTSVGTLQYGIIHLNKGAKLDAFIDELRKASDDDPTEGDGYEIISTEGHLLFGFNEWRKKNSNEWIGQVSIALPAKIEYDSRTGHLALHPLKAQLFVSTKHLESQANENSARHPVLGMGELIPSSEDDLSDDIAWHEYWEDANKTFELITSTAEVLTGYAPQRLEKAVFPSEKNNTQLPVIFMGVSAGSHKSNMTRGLRGLVAAELDGCTPQNPVIARLLSDSRGPNFPALSASEIIERHSTALKGSMACDFPLDAAQRRVVMHTKVFPSPLFDVSGPPGTGKTAMLRSFVANCVVEGALAGEPVSLVAVSATNQATTNIINAFFLSDRQGSVAGDITQRWLEGLPSLGWFMPAASNARAPEYQKYQLLLLKRGSFTCGGAGTNFGSSLTPPPSVIDSHLDVFMSHFSAWSGHDKTGAQETSLKKALALLQTEISNTVKRQSDIIETAEETIESCLLGIRLSDANAAHAQYESSRKQRSSSPIANPEHAAGIRYRIKHLDGLMAVIQDYEASDKVILPRITRRREYKEYLQKTKLLRRELSAGTDNNASDLIREGKDLVRELKRQLKELELTVERERLQANATLDPKYGPMLDLQRSIIGLFDNDMRAAISAAFAQEDIQGLPPSPHQLLKQNLDVILEVLSNGFTQYRTQDHFRLAIQSLLDVTLRYKAFCLSCRYFEGLWIQRCISEPGDNLSINENLSRIAMLAPLIVSTSYSCHNLIKEWNTDSREDRFNTNLFDWIIVDEAGQVAPSRGVPALALAKQALIVGDIEQIAPVVNLCKSVEETMLKKCGLDPTSEYATARREISGSLMALAISRSCLLDGDGKGLSLTFHYRCRESIIAFCNELVYSKTTPLIPQIRDAKPNKESWREPGSVRDLNPKSEAFLPPMGFVDIEGKEDRSSGVSNLIEAKEIVQWIQKNRNAIESAYGGRIEDVVAVIAPFKRQANLLAEMLNRVGITTSATKLPKAELQQKTLMTIGTVHALQGAERPIVLFSLTSSDRNNTSFIDSSTSMLNVAVSRAQHSFIVFANGSALFNNTAKGCPVYKLGNYMKRVGYRLYPRDLVIVESPGKGEIINASLGKIAHSAATLGNIKELDRNAIVGPSPKALVWNDNDNTKHITTAIKKHISLGSNHFDYFVIATDDDLAGELIAWHLIEIIQELDSELPRDQILRMRFYAVEEEHLKAARTHAHPLLDGNRVKAAIARDVLNIAMSSPQASRQQAALLDAVNQLNQPSKILYLDTDQGPFAAVEGRAPFGPALSPPDQLPTLQNGALTTSDVVTLEYVERDYPPPNTANIIATAIESTDLSISDIELGLEELYLGRKLGDAK